MKKYPIKIVAFLLSCLLLVFMSSCGTENTDSNESSSEEVSSEETTEESAFPQKEPQSEVETGKQKETAEEAVSSEETTEKSALAPEESQSEVETEEQKETAKEADILKKYDSEIIAAAKRALDDGFGTYCDVSLEPENWTIAKYDESDTKVIAMTDISYNGNTGKYIFVGTLILDDSGKVENARPHYLEVDGFLLGTDGSCTDVSDKIKSLSSGENVNR